MPRRNPHRRARPQFANNHNPPPVPPVPSALQDILSVPVEILVFRIPGFAISSHFRNVTTYIEARDWFVQVVAENTASAALVNHSVRAVQVFPFRTNGRLNHGLRLIIIVHPQLLGA